MEQLEDLLLGKTGRGADGAGDSKSKCGIRWDIKWASPKLEAWRSRAEGHSSTCGLRVRAGEGRLRWFAVRGKGAKE